MKIQLRRSKDRGFFDFGWLRTQHTFSFADYYDPEHMRFRTLRVINQDVVQPGHGFDTHPHNDMEIITYVLRGAVVHKDTMGNETIIRAGEIQCMSAGTGVKHSEYNRSTTDELELLQIWIFPNQKNLPPSYQQQAYDSTQLGFQLLVAPIGSDGLVSIHQDAKIFRVLSNDTDPLHYPIATQRAVWVQLISGEALINGELLAKGDGASISEESMLTIIPQSPLHLLLFDL